MTSLPRIPTITIGLRPFAPSEVVSTLLVTVCALPGGSVRLEYALEGRIGALRVPSVHLSAPLWQHTCLEAFISSPEEARYREYNFSPSGQWAGGAFSHYREMEHTFEEESLLMNLPITSTSDENWLVLTAEIPPTLLPDAPVLRLGLSAVVERNDGTLEYWAIHHPADLPDFHHADSWTLRLDTRLNS